ncbi:MAG: hypothetical protein LIP01_07855 [Tannerellaceae bacterium]|nr:hypothetical protein [Tannerellaceae bacterium]
MKMNKYFLYVVLTALTACFTISCSSDDVLAGTGVGDGDSKGAGTITTRTDTYYLDPDVLALF